MAQGSFCSRARSVIGARSAVFAPLKNIGPIVVDEETKPLDKQEEAPRYHARDVAVVRAKIERAVVLARERDVVDAESYHNTLTEKIPAREPDPARRHHNCQMPLIRVIDLRRNNGAGATILSEKLRSAIQSDRKTRREQFCFLIGARFSTSLLAATAESARLSHCSVALTFHRSMSLVELSPLRAYCAKEMSESGQERVN